MQHLKIFEDFLDENKDLKDNILSTLKFLEDRSRILFLTTSTRWVGDKETPKSSLIAEYMKSKLGDKVQIIDVSKLKIYTCEGNVSKKDGNNCGVKEALLKNTEKNPSNQHRCWASINNQDDELWKISKAMLASDTVIFFASVRWGQTNSIYQRLIERLTWLENRHSTYGESNILENIKAGIILIGQNWRGMQILTVQKQVLKFFGFDTAEALNWNWQFTQNYEDETQESYLAASKEFESDLNQLKGIKIAK